MTMYKSCQVTQREPSPLVLCVWLRLVALLVLGSPHETTGSLLLGRSAAVGCLCFQACDSRIFKYRCRCCCCLLRDCHSRLFARVNSGLLVDRWLLDPLLYDLRVHVLQCQVVPVASLSRPGIRHSRAAGTCGCCTLCSSTKVALC
jgi:hypothetical protein